jgi:hypothetical protein
MTPEEQRIAIAEACGLTKETHIVVGDRNQNTYVIWKKKSFEIKLPDYPNDLNAMRKAEEVLKDKGVIGLYMDHLNAVTRENDEYFVMASAKSCSKAFLLTLNLWK